MVSLKDNLVELNFDVLREADETLSAICTDLGLVFLKTPALFIEYTLTSSKGNSLKKIDHPHVVCLMYELLNSSFGRIDLSDEFERDREKCSEGLSNRAANPIPKNNREHFILELFKRCFKIC